MLNSVIGEDICYYEKNSLKIFFYLSEYDYGKIDKILICEISKYLFTFCTLG